MKSQFSIRSLGVAFWLCLACFGSVSAADANPGAGVVSALKSGDRLVITSTGGTVSYAGTRSGTR